MERTIPRTQAPEIPSAERKPFQGFRKVYHVVAASLFPLFYLNPILVENRTEAREWLLWVTGACFVVSFLLDLVRLRDQRFNSRFMWMFSALIRQNEKNRFNGSTFLCLAFFVVIFLFPWKVAVAAMLFLSLGDAAAELGGKYFGRLKFFGRSLEGTLSFFFVAFLVAFALFEDWRIAAFGAMAGALIELFSFDVDDNLTVPIGSALVLSLALFLFLGVALPGF